MDPQLVELEIGNVVAPKIKLMEQKGNFMWFSLSSLNSQKQTGNKNG